jgi:hypothetical protein
MEKSSIDGLIKIQEKAYLEKRISQSEYEELKAVHKRLYELSRTKNLSPEQHLEQAHLLGRSGDIVMGKHSNKTPSLMKRYFKRKFIGMAIGLFIGLVIIIIEKW